MAQDLRIYEVRFEKQNVTAESLQTNLNTYSRPIPLDSAGYFIVPIRLPRKSFDELLARNYKEFAIIDVRREDKSTYKSKIWEQIEGVVNDAQANNINIDF